ncbi:unnamed protein product, partial [Brenthis ino]
MSSGPIPATAANLIETSQLLCRYNSISAARVSVCAQTQVHSLFLSLSTSVGRHETRPVRVKAQARWFLRALRGMRAKRGLLLRLTIIQKDSITKLSPTRGSTQHLQVRQPYMLTSTPPRQLGDSYLHKRIKIQPKLLPP